MRFIKLKIISVVTLLVFSSSVLAVSKPFLKEKCDEAKGQIVEQWSCPYSGDEREDPHCLIYDDQNRPMYFNGCSGTIGDYDKVFFKACVYHDLCYHHEPMTNGLIKEDCDSQFFNDMFEICDNRPDDHDCEDMARWFYNAVDMFGKDSWICSKQPANYPRKNAWSPWFQNLIR